MPLLKKPSSSLGLSRVVVSGGVVRVKIQKKFECSVCCSEWNENRLYQRLQCSRCSYVVCGPCQKSYCKVDCMNCHMEFSYLTIIEKLGKTFVDRVLKPAAIAELLVEEKQKLPLLTPLLQWKRKVETIEARVRFGEVYLLPEKPGYSELNGAFPCPRSECRGFYYCNPQGNKVGEEEGGGGGSECYCEQCQYELCGLCENVFGKRGEEKGEEKMSHVCDQNVIENRKAILSETKPCPKCHTRIYRTQGCDHMKCTFCQTLFSWATGAITIRTTNYHYEGLEHQIRRNTTTGGGEGGEGGGGGEECLNEITELPLIPKDTLLSSGAWSSDPLNVDFIEALYEESSTIRFFKFSKYSDMKMLEAKESKRQDMALDFLRNRLSEKDWGLKVFSLMRNYRRDVSISRIYHLYLACVDQLMSNMYRGVVKDLEEALRCYSELVSMFSSCLDSVQNEFGYFDPKNSPKIESFILKWLVVGGHEVTVDVVGGGDVGEEKKKGKGKEEKVMSSVSKHITLYPYQIQHVETLLSVFRRNYYALDLSMLGSGKTYSASSIYQNKAFGFQHMVVVSPVAVLAKWKRVVSEYGLKNVVLISYAELRSVKGKQPKHGLLARRDYFDEVPEVNAWGDFIGTMRMIPKVEFKCTEKYLRMCKEERTLLVFDEFQNLKNVGDQSAAAKELIRPLAVRRGGVGMRCIGGVWVDADRSWRDSKALMMSGSPMDKKEHFVHLMRTLCVHTSDQLATYHVHRGTYSHDGGEQIYSHIHSLADISDDLGDGLVVVDGKFERSRFYNKGGENYWSYRSTEKEKERKWMVMREMYDIPCNWRHSNSETVMSYCFEYFIRFLKGAVSSAMIAENNAMESEKVSAVYRVQEDSNRRLISRGLRKLSSVVEDLTLRSVFTDLQERRFALMEGQRMIETGMIPTMIRVCRARLTENPMLKVVLCVNFSETVSDLMVGLRDFMPLEYTGSLSRKKKESHLAAFQAPSLDCRLLIGNLTCLSTGIDLDDKDGRFPRLCLSRPSYSTITLYQLSHRFNRGLETKSVARVEFMYGGDLDDGLDDGLDDDKNGKGGGDSMGLLEMMERGQNRILEKSILKCLARKGDVMKLVSSEQSKAGVLFPGDYHVWFEEEEV